MFASCDEAVRDEAETKGRVAVEEAMAEGKFSSIPGR